MRKVGRMRVAAVLAVLMACAALSAQYSSYLSLGRSTLFSVPSARLALTESASLRTALRSVPYLSAVGGVTFESVGRPVAPIQKLELRYLPAKPDGQRLWVNMDGRWVHAPAYDWQLLPIAHFADSKYTACFTLFGDPDLLGDPDTAERVASQGGRVIQFHPALKDTLLGLRLMQLDLLIISDDATDLPRNSGQYLLGRGETPPSLEANQRSAAFIRSSLDRFMEKNLSFDTYVINDQSADVKISATAQYLVLTGNPAYHTVSIEGASDEDRRAVANRALNRWLNENRAALRSINPAIWDSAVNTLRYAAFFRYCKRSHPEAWQSLLAQIRDVTPVPALKTPDVLVDPRRKEQIDSLANMLRRFRQEEDR